MNRNKFSRILSLVVIFMLLVGCKAPTATIPTQEVSTATAVPTMTASPIPTRTLTPSPSATHVPTYTPTPTVVPLTGTAIAAGGSHTCAVTDRGGVLCWGSNWFGELGDGTTTTRHTPVDVVGLTNGAAAVAVGEGHTCALTTRGGVKCWGANWTGQLGDGTTEQRLIPVDVVGLTSGVKAISAGYNHTCALIINGGVKCWGYNWGGQLGDGTTEDRLTPVDVVGLTNGAAAVAVGEGHACALTTRDGVKCWGANWTGQLGDGTTEQRLIPVDVVGLTSGVKAISAGYNHTCALIINGGVKCWGYNYSGQLGDWTTDQRLTLVQVQGLTISATAIAAGTSHTCALTTSGEVKCWGNNGSGQLGDGSTEDRMTPVQVVELPIRPTAIAAGGAHTCALTSSGSVQCWGSNEYGQLGDGSGEDWLVPGEVVGLTSGVTAVDAGESHTCALTMEGGVKCWGSGRSGDNTSMVTPVDLEGFTSGVSLVSTGGRSSCHSFCNCTGMTCVFTPSSGVTCWYCDPARPVDIVELERDVISISTCWYHACASMVDGGVKCWGSNQYGQLGDGTTSSRQSPMDVVGLTDGIKLISAGLIHVCGLTNRGAVKCWGNNYFGQLGDGTNELRLTPVQVVGLTISAAAVASGGTHTCALTTSGGVKCWGDNDNGQLGNGTTEQRLSPVNIESLTSGVKAISAGINHTCVVTIDGAVKCWGANEHGQLGDGTTKQRLTPVDVVGLTSGVLSVAAGADHTCAITTDGGVVCWGNNLHGTLGRGTSAIQTKPVDVVGFGP